MVYITGSIQIWNLITHLILWFIQASAIKSRVLWSSGWETLALLNLNYIIKLLIFSLKDEKKIRNPALDFSIQNWGLRNSSNSHWIKWEAETLTFFCFKITFKFWKKNLQNINFLEMASLNVALFSQVSLPLSLILKIDIFLLYYSFIFKIDSKSYFFFFRIFIFDFSRSSSFGNMYETNLA